MYNRIMRKQRSYYDDLWLKRERELISYDIGWNYEKRRIDSAILSLIRKLLATHDHHKLLEVGMGKGDLALKIVRHFDKTQITYVGMDISKQGVKIAYNKMGDSSFYLLVADGMHLPFNSETFDIVICSEVIEHIPDKEKLLHQISSVLKKDGLLILTTPNPNAVAYLIPKLLRRISNRNRFGSAQPLNDLIDSVELEVLLKENGFKIINQVGLVLVFYTTNLIEGFLKFPLTPLRKIFEHLEKTSPFAPHTLYQLVLARNK